MRKLLFLLCFLPIFCFGQYRADRVRTNPNVSDGAGYCFRGHTATAVSAYCAEATALFARMTTPPTDTRKGQINTLITSLKTAGVWSKLDVFYVFAAADQQAALLNWKGDTNNATTSLSPPFKIDTGYVGGTGYINTHYNPTQDGVNFSQDNASSFIYIHALSVAQGDNRIFGAYDGTNWHYLVPNYNGGAMLMSVNSTPAHAPTPIISTTGLCGISRNSSTLETIYRTSGTSTNTANSTGLVNENIHVLTLWYAGAAYSNYSGTVSMFCTGSAFSQTNYDDLKTAINAFIGSL